ncbi:MAG TPA: DUF4349 domain-containing protein [Solirubrobacterales bacterium]|nr:DUF4349 domain-containing protein [Solirubrobacterales bacterium]
MEPHRDEDRLAEDLRALKPTPRPQFAAELDERAAAGFPRRSRLRLPSLGALESLRPRRLLLPAGAAALLAIVVGTAVVSTSQNGDEGESAVLERFSAPANQEPQSERSAGAPQSTSPAGGEASAEEDSGTSSARSSDFAAPMKPVAPGPGPRAVERSAELVLGAAPGDVGEDSSEVFDVVHAHDGIVINSSTREGKPGQAGARFELLIPSAKLSDALAALSGIDEVRSRHEATTDITAPTVTTSELLRDSKARIDSLLAQLEAAGTESEREVVEAELLQERRHRASLRANLQNLQRRADLSRVLVQIVTGTVEEPSSGGAWGVGDALGDAGKFLAVAAAVAVVGLAILGPIALIALLAWLAHRAWVRRERRRVLS